MTVQFNCPKCNALIAFADKHCGKRARCLTCGQFFIIPSQDEEKAKKVKLKAEKTEPVPGFYRAAFVDGWRLFTKPENATRLLLILTAVCFKFFVARLTYSVAFHGPWLTIEFPLPIGFILNIATWGFLFWYYMEIIYSTAFELEKLPDVNMGGFYGLLWHIIKSIYIFIIALLVVDLPFVITVVILRIAGVELPVLLYVLLLGGLFLFPMAVLTVAIGRDLTMLRPDYLLVPIFRAVKPYLGMSMLLGAAGVLQTQTNQYTGQGLARSTVDLSLNLAVQVIAIIAMRSIGLFHRHYACYLPW